MRLFANANIPDADGNARPEPEQLVFIKRSVERLTELFGPTALHPTAA